jgi:tetratricopeptide (TPR) repeat protein
VDDAIALYERRVAASPGEVREHRFLARAYFAARDHQRAAKVIDAGLELAPEGRALIEARGEARAAAGDVEGALADWRRSLDPDGHSIGGAYMSAFLLEREGRLAEAIEAWAYVLEYDESRGYKLPAEWPKRELERLRAELAAR